MTLTIPEKHQKKKALATLKMNAVGAGIIGGVTKQEARNYLEGIGYSKEII